MAKCVQVGKQLGCVGDVQSTYIYLGCLQALGYRKYSTASDVWSYGCVLYEMWSLGQKPLSHWTIEEVWNCCQLKMRSVYTAISHLYCICMSVYQQFYNNLLEGYRQSPPPGCPRSIYKLMMDCWLVGTQEVLTVARLSKLLSNCIRSYDVLLRVILCDWRTVCTVNCALCAL